MEKNTGALKEQMYSWILEEMEQAESVGVGVFVDGMPYTLADAECLYQVMERAYYMKNYVGDGEGRITEINFEHLKNV